MRFLRAVMPALLPLFLAARFAFGHACDDPWRPDPSSVGGPSGGGSGVIVAPPPPPPAPGELPPSIPGGPSDPTNPSAPINSLQSGLANQLPVDQAGGGGGNLSPDSIVLIPETSQLKLAGKQGEFRTYIVNRSPRDLFAVKLEALSSAFDIEVVPDMLKRLVSGEKDYFTVKLKVKGQLKSGKFPMDFKVSTRGNLIYEGSLGDGGAKEAQKENLGIRPPSDPIQIADQGSFTVYIKNNIYNEINSVKVQGMSKYFDISAAPGSVDKLAPGREAKFVVTLVKKKGVKSGAYDIRLHALTSSRNVFSSKIITIHVGENKAEAKR